MTRTTISKSTLDTQIFNIGDVVTVKRNGRIRKAEIKKIRVEYIKKIGGGSGYRHIYYVLFEGGKKLSGYADFCLSK